jgi:hypothetical protein
VAIFTPATVPWTSAASDLLVTYDWDTLALDGSSQAFFSLPVQLCVGFFPCFLSIHGNGNKLLRTGSGSISCSSSRGCSGISVQSVRIACYDSSRSTSPVFRAHRSALMIQNATFSSCSSSIDGGVIQSYDEATVLIQHSRFEDLQTSGSGAALSAVGGRVNITGSLFSNCSADHGGGAMGGGYEAGDLRFRL